MSVFAGEDYGGIGNLAVKFYILNANGKDGNFTTVRRRDGNNRLIVIKNHNKKFGYSSDNGSFIQTEKWLKSPFPDGYIEYKAEKDCLLKWEFYHTAPPTGDKHWTEMKMFVNGKMVPSSAFKIRNETEFNSLPKVNKKVPYTYKRKGKKITSYRNKRVSRKIKNIPAATQGGVVINSYRRAIYTKALKKGESFKCSYEVKAISEITFVD